MEELKDKIHDRGNGHLLKLEGVVSILDTLVDECKMLVEMELIPYVDKYLELCNNVQPESRFRDEDLRVLFPK